MSVICLKCGSPIPKEAKFCASCGEKRPETKVCSFCNEENGLDAVYCTECGRSFEPQEEKEVENKGRLPLRSTNPPISITKPSPINKEEALQMIQEDNWIDNVATYSIYALIFAFIFTIMVSLVFWGTSSDKYDEDVMAEEIYEDEAIEVRENDSRPKKSWDEISKLMNSYKTVEDKSDNAVYTNDLAMFCLTGPVKKMTVAINGNYDEKTEYEFDEDGYLISAHRGQEVAEITRYNSSFIKDILIGRFGDTYCYDRNGRVSQVVTNGFLGNTCRVVVAYNDMGYPIKYKEHSDWARFGQGCVTNEDVNVEYSDDSALPYPTWMSCVETHQGVAIDFSEVEAGTDEYYINETKTNSQVGYSRAIEYFF